jgi:N-acetylmuramoyl-L-alanine amidase
VRPAPAVAVAPVAAAPQIAPRDATRIAPLPLSNTVRTVVLDPGHGADEVGAAANGVVEKHSNLELATRVEALLSQHGVRVLITRRTDERVYAGAPIAGYSATRRDLQARIDLANESGADIFVSLHSNGAGSTAERGIETYYNSQRPFSNLSYALAATLQASVVSEMRAVGYTVVDRGVKDDACLKAFQGRCFPLFVLGPGRTTSREEIIARGGSPEALGMAPGQPSTSSRPTNMPGALLESLFVSNPADAALLRDPDARDTLARGITRGIIDYLNAHQ